MNGNFKVELKDKTTGIAVKTVTVDAKITDYWKYESTYGYPFINRGESGQTLHQYLLQLPFSSAGIQLFENQLSTKRDKFRTKLSDTYIAYASRYNAAANPEQYSSKAGHMSDYQVTTDFNQSATVGGQVTYTMKWSWDASQGNGTFKSLGTLNAQGAHAKDTTPILQNGAESLSTVSAGQDFSVTTDSSYVTSPSVGANRLVNVDDTSTMQGSSSPLNYIAQGIVSERLDNCAWYYQTDNNIVQLWFNKRNEYQQDSTYLSEIRYRVINKKALNRFHLGQVDGLHPLQYNPDLFDGSFNINTGSHQLFPIKLYMDRLCFGAPAKIQNSGYCVFCALDSNVANANPNPDNKTPNRHSSAPWYKVKTYVIKGDSPELISFSSSYDSPLSAITTPWSSDNKYYRYICSCTGFLFTRDFAYIYSDTQNNKVVKRYLSGDTFAWEIDNSAPANVMLTFMDNEPDCFGMCNYYADLYGANVGNHTTVQYTLLNQIDKSTHGYFLKPTGGGTENADYKRTQVSLSDYRLDNPFMLDINSERSLPQTSNYLSYNLTDALFAKANLPEPITKTSDYTLDITFTLHIY